MWASTRYLQYTDQGGVLVTDLTDLLKEFDCIPYNLFLAKLGAFGLDKKNQLINYVMMFHRGSFGDF